jgi:hypothetical protein
VKALVHTAPLRLECVERPVLRRDRGDGPARDRTDDSRVGRRQAVRGVAVAVLASQRRRARGILSHVAVTAARGGPTEVRR